MYYDRCVPDILLETILPDGPLGWLVAWVRSQEGSSALADLQLRRSRAGACLQLYMGATSVISIHLARGMVRFRADKAYETLAPALFNNTRGREVLSGVRSEISEYLALVRPRVARRYLTSESEIHGGFMRRYSLDTCPSDLCVVLDREVRIGYDNVAERGSIRQRLDSQLPMLARGNYVELDAIAALSGSGIGMVEIKDWGDAASLVVAAEQAAVHVRRFSMLDDEKSGWRQSLHQLAQQKVQVGLLSRVPELHDKGPLVPVIAASDERSDWVDHWRAAILPTLTACGAALTGLQMWRLSRSGEIRERATP